MVGYPFLDPPLEDGEGRAGSEFGVPVCRHKLAHPKKWVDISKQLRQKVVSLEP